MDKKAKQNIAMKIGIDVSKTVESKDGISNYIRNLVKNLAEIDKTNEYVLYPFFTHIFLPGYEKAYCPENKNFKLRFKDWPESLARYLWLKSSTNKELLLGKIDVLHSTCWEAFEYHYGKLIVTIHDTSFLTHPQFHVPSNIALANNGCLNAVKYADKIIAVSENTKKDTVKYFSCDPEKIEVVYLGADERFRVYNKIEINAVLSKYNINKKYIFNVGSIEPRKNLIGLFNAYNSLPDNLKEEYDLIITGSCGWLNSEIYGTVKNLGLQNKIRFTGSVPDEDLPYLYNGATIFVYPSFYEGFGLPVLEAMQCGCPVITSNNSSLPEVAGDAALFINPDVVNDIKNGMEKSLMDEGLRKELSIKGLNRARKFSWEKCARETLEIYENLAK